MKIPNTNTAASSKDTADPPPPPSEDDRPRHSSPIDSSEEQQATTSRDDNAPLLERKHGDVVEDQDPQEQQPPKQKESPSSSNEDVDNRSVSLPNRKKNAVSDDIFLDNVPIMDNRKQIEMEMSHGEPPMTKKPAARLADSSKQQSDEKQENDSKDVPTKNQPSTMIYDLGASPPPNTKLPTKISTTAQKLLARIPSVSQKKKKNTVQSNQVNENDDLHSSSRNKFPTGDNICIENNDCAEDERKNASDHVLISVEEFHAQKRKVQEMQDNYDHRIEVLERNYDKRIQELEGNHNKMIRELEGNYDRRIRDLEENRDSRIPPLEPRQHEMLSLLPTEVPQGAAGEETDNPTLHGEPQNRANIMRRSQFYTIFRNYEMLYGQDRDANKANIENDTFSLMMISKVKSRSWALGLVAFFFQITLGIMIASDQAGLSTESSVFSVPFKVDLVVRVGQFFAIMLCLATQSDILTSVQCILLLRKGSDWDVVIGEAGNKSTRLWIIRILLPNLLKFAQGLLVLYVSFVIIIQSDNIIDLLKDFTALMVLAETDNILFHLATYGYLGETLMEQTTKVSVTTVPKAPPTNATDTLIEPSMEPTIQVEGHQRKLFCIRILVLLCLFAPVLGGWIYIVTGQINGKFFHEKYPKCNFPGAFKDAKIHFGDGVCYGGPLNKLGCAFEGGDCVNFNLAFPLCKGENRTDVQTRVGNSKCEKVFMSPDCDYDGGDCCPYEIMDDPSFGDGICDEKANTEGCGYDNGDCVDYNRDYSGCPLDVVFGNPLFGNGECHGGIASTKNCSYDNGDCNEFILAFPKCPLDDLSSQVEGADDVVIGDGICDSGVYNLEECGYEFEDCNYGQVGQTVSITGYAIERFGYNSYVFSKVLSSDGMTMALGLPVTDEDGSGGTLYFDDSGLVKIWRYNSSRKMWLQFGKDIVGKSREGIGRVMSLSANGNRLMISSSSGKREQIRIYDFNVTSNEWIPVGQTITSRLIDSTGAIMTSDGLKVALLYSLDEVRIYDVNEAPDHHVIESGVTLSRINTQLMFNTKDGSRLLLSTDDVTKVYRFNPDNTTKSWTQIGKDIESQSSSLSPAISADGNRIAVPTNASSTNAIGQVDVYDYDAVDDVWVAVGNPIKSSSSGNGDGFGYDIKMSSDGNLLVIASNHPECRQSQRSEFSINDCTTGSIEVYNFNYDQFQKVLPNSASPFKADGNVLNLTYLVSNSAIFGSHFSMDGDGSVLSISGYNVDDESAFVEVYNLNELFYTKCNVNHGIGDGECKDWPPYNSEECGFDGGYCERNPVEGWPGCFVHSPGLIGNGHCHDYPPYNSKECGFDGGDCVLKPVDGYPECLILPKDHNKIGDGYCHNSPPYNTEECGFDGGDCVLKPVEGWPDCFVLRPGYIGNRRCDDWPPYNSEECGFDGGDCVLKPVDGYPDCIILAGDHDYIGDGECYDWPPYNSAECGSDGGDCEQNPVEGWPDCFVFSPGWIGDGECDDWPPYNSEECGFDGGDCEQNPVEGWPDCFVHDPDKIGNGYCYDRPPYNSKECGFDGGDCAIKPVDGLKPVEGWPDCFVLSPGSIGDGRCDDVLPYNSKECGLDGGDCEQPVEGYPECVTLPQYHDYIGNGLCDDNPPVINSEDCGFDGGDCIEQPVEGYPECVMLPQYHDYIGNGQCDDNPPVISSEDCGFDGGDCIEQPVEGYPGCLILPQYHDYIGDGICRDWPPYNTEECGFDGGDCERNPVEGWPDCFVHNPDDIGDGRCDDWPPYNSEECGFDGGDCVLKPVDGYRECFVLSPYRIGNGDCNDYPPYNSKECGFDGGDCRRNPVEGWPDCFVHYTDLIGNGPCHDYPPYNSEECGFDGGDCERNPVEGWPDCFVHSPGRIGDGRCYDDPPYNTEECGFDGGDCLPP